jgi:DNA-binding transcriptional regulator GbsR (MarR family)
MKLGMDSIPPSGFHKLSPSARAVITDVFEHPGTTISEIVERIELPQSQVSAAVVKLSELRAFVTFTDPLDRRKTVVSPAPGMEHKARKRTTGSIEPSIKKALRDYDQSDITKVIDALEVLATALSANAYSFDQKGDK